MPTLTWLTRDDDLKRAAAAPYRLLEAVPELGAGDVHSGNMLIQGDNLDALMALLPYYAGRVKCIYIDPPYNTRSAFEHYDDNLQHAEWLAMIYPRLELLRELLSEDGSIWVSIDDNEGHYLKVIMDEIFGRSNFLANVIWQKAYGPRSNAYLISDSHDHIIVFGKNFERQEFGLLDRSDEQTAKYRISSDDPRGAWKPENSSISLLSGQRGKQFAKTGVSENVFEIIGPNGEVHLPPKNRCWAFSEKRYLELLNDGRISFGEGGKGRPSIKRFLNEISPGVKPQTVWLHDEVGHNQDASREIRSLFPEHPFATPKPEKLLNRILRLASKPGDIVLDSFLGSGTTAAVAHKMGRRYIGIEMGEHAETHCAPRLRKVIDGEQGGISESVGWKGGGGFAFYRLGEAVFGDDGRINPAIPFAHLAAHIWFSEIGEPLDTQATTPWLGAADGRGLALLYNGILGDKSVSGGNVLTAALLKRLRTDAGGFAGPMTIYGEASRLGPERLKAEGVTFKQTPYDVRAR